MTIPFVRQYPGLRRGLTEISCFPAIEMLGREFMAKGGKYLIEVLGTGEARLAACVLDESGQQRDVEVIVCPNDKGLMEQVNQLISRSVDHVREGETKH